PASCEPVHTGIAPRLCAGSLRGPAAAGRVPTNPGAVRAATNRWGPLMFSFVGKLLRIAVAAAAALVLVAGAAMARSNAGNEPGRITIEVNKSTQRMTVTVDGEKRYTFKVSTGKTGHTTPSGSFRVLSMKEMHYSRKYDNAPMPNALFF